MCPQEAKVFLVDDNKMYLEVLSDFLAMEGHLVVSSATSLISALDAISKLKEVDVALIDGNLSNDSRDGTDGKRVAEEFRKRFPGKPVFAISADEQSWSDDPNLTKRNSSMEIAKRITES